MTIKPKRKTVTLEPEVAYINASFSVKETFSNNTYTGLHVGCDIADLREAATEYIKNIMKDRGMTFSAINTFDVISARPLKDLIAAANEVNIQEIDITSEQNKLMNMIVKYKSKETYEANKDKFTKEEQLYIEEHLKL